MGYIKFHYFDIVSVSDVGLEDKNESLGLVLDHEVLFLALVSNIWSWSWSQS